MGLDRLHRADDDFIFLAAEAVELAFALGLAQALGDDLFGRLRRDASKIIRRHIDHHLISNFRVRLALLDLFQRHLGLLIGHIFLGCDGLFSEVDTRQTGLQIDLSRHILIGADVPISPIRAHHRRSDRVQHNVSRQVIFSADLIKCQGELTLH